eukprot:89935-Chlamydomonas_euryale.AAC.1
MPSDACSVCRATHAAPAEGRMQHLPRDACSACRATHAAPAEGRIQHLPSDACSACRATHAAPAGRRLHSGDTRAGRPAFPHTHPAPTPPHTSPHHTGSHTSLDLTSRHTCPALTPTARYVGRGLHKGGVELCRGRHQPCYTCPHLHTTRLPCIAPPQDATQMPGSMEG